jgi:hypothetical protein
MEYERAIEFKIKHLFNLAMVKAVTDAKELADRQAKANRAMGKPATH